MAEAGINKGLHMAEVTRKRAGELVRGVFEILMQHPDGVAAQKVLEMLAERVELTEFEKSNYPSTPNTRRFEKIVRFMTIGPVKAGWMLKNKGLWTITESGREAYKKYDDPAEFRKVSDRLYREWKRERDDQESEENVEVDGSPPSTTLEEAEEAAWTEIEDYLSKINPYDFQDLVAGLLRGMGYHVSWVAPAGPDKGVDIIAYRDPLGVEKGRILVQVKRRADKINVGEVRSFLAVLGDEDVGIFVTTAGFTSDAESEARTQERRRMMLLDAKRLFDLWVEHYDRVPEAQRRLLPLRQVYYLAPSE